MRMGKIMGTILAYSMEGGDAVDFRRFLAWLEVPARSSLYKAQFDIPEYRVL